MPGGDDQDRVALGGSIRLMPDHGCFPLWHAAPDAVGNIDPQELPLSAALRSRLLAWAGRYNATLDPDDPLASGFASQGEEDGFEQEGRAIAADLREELGGGYTVVYRA